MHGIRFFNSTAFDYAPIAGEPAFPEEFLAIARRTSPKKCALRSDN
jgi:hypothetical protein